MIDNFIAYWGVACIKGVTVVLEIVGGPFISYHTATTSENKPGDNNDSLVLDMGCQTRQNPETSSNLY